MSTLNCWEYFECGREPGGEHVAELGVCPAATSAQYNGVHGGKNAGRACWTVTGTYCNGKVSGSYAEKLPDCKICAFYQFVMQQEYRAYS